MTSSYFLQDLRVRPHSLTVLSSYEPMKLFPGLIYRMVKPRIVLLIFVAARSCYGAKVRQEIYEALDNIYPILKNSRSNDPY